MSKIVLTNVGVVLTEKCNFNCSHCMRGGSLSRDMDVETMRNIFKQTYFIGNLNICGGEPFINPELLERFISTIIQSGVILGEYSITTNGTYYTEEVDILLNELDEYIKRFSKYFRGNVQSQGRIDLSWDDFHKAELRNIKSSNPKLFENYISNIQRLVNSKRFDGFRLLNGIFNVGNAKNLDPNGTLPIRYMRHFSYLKKGYLYSGPVLSICTDGTISECDGEFETLRKEHNYGNINTDSLEEVINSISIPKHSMLTFNLSCQHAYEKYISYKK